MFQLLDSLILWLSADMPIHFDPDTSLTGCWFLPPWQHAFELIVLAPSFAYLSYKWLYRLTSDEHSMQRVVFSDLKALRSTRSLDLIIAGFLFTTLSFLVTYKHYHNSLAFLLQPCHVHSLLLAMLLLASPDTLAPHVIFNIMLCNLWGSFIALIVPDFRDYSLLFEVEIFWIEHIALVVIPIYLVYSRRLILWPSSRDIILLSYFIFALYHIIVLGLVSLMTGSNLNYMLVPPPGFMWLGRWYRIVIFAAGLVFTMMSRYAFAKLFAGLIEATPAKFVESVVATNGKNHVD